MELGERDDMSDPYRERDDMKPMELGKMLHKLLCFIGTHDWIKIGKVIYDYQNYECKHCGRIR